MSTRYLTIPAGLVVVGGGLLLGAGIAHADPGEATPPGLKASAGMVTRDPHDEPSLEPVAADPQPADDPPVPRR